MRQIFKEFKEFEEFKEWFARDIGDWWDNWGLHEIFFLKMFVIMKIRSTFAAYYEKRV